MRMKTESLLIALLALAGLGAAQDSLDIKYKGAAWLQFGRIQHSTDSLVNGGNPNNMNGNWIQAAGVQISTVARFSPQWEGAMGMGALQTHNARGDVSVANNWYPYWVTFVSEARVTYSNPITETQKVSLNLGFFPYNYNPDVKDLGLYLLRGYVYPGTPISGFEARHTTAAANIFGAMAGYSVGGFKNDLLLISETDNRPYFDMSLADVASMKFGPAFELGAGVNFYRALPRNAKNTSPGKDCKNVVSGYTQIDPGDNQVCYIIDTLSVDIAANTAVTDTILGSLAGTKLMGRFRFDPKAFMGDNDLFGKQDLVVYGEVGVLGTKDYRKYYDDIKRRIPVMMGLNLPAFGRLDKFALEVEYYASKNMSDYGKAEADYSWVPRVAPGVDNAKDDLKWSLYFSRVMMGHFRLSGQVANDHLRMFGPPDIGFTSYAETSTTLKDWYWMLKTTYFF
ncbi:MAG: hypothetical protein JWP91_2423 [Fibrobacteres bacterium]|nr:hypothetical protein [Fibrobacterota bacterium]